MTPAQAGLPPFCCPLCKGLLERQEEAGPYRCPSCSRTYPVVLGIPDFRVWRDPYISNADDWAKAATVLAEAGRDGFQAMVEHYWRLTPGVPPGMAARFTRYSLVGVARGQTRLNRIVELRGASFGRSDVLLDLGCGTGGLVVAASGQAGAVVGVDIAARWLVIARRRLEEAGVSNAVLVCACAEHLPFPNGGFDVVIANDVLEHSQDQLRLLCEVRRTLRPGGLLLLATQNRWSLLGEPHIRVWGVGFLPRRWMAAYVRLARGVAYRHIRLVAPLELRALLYSAGLQIVRHLLPRVEPGEIEGLSNKERRLVALYDRLAAAPLLRLLLLGFGPSLELAAKPRPARPGACALDRGTSP